MNAKKISFWSAIALFVGFLIAPGFVDSISGAGVITMMPGFAAVIWQAVNGTCSILNGEMSGDVLLSLFVTAAHAAFVVMPLLVLTGKFRRPGLRRAFFVAFLCGLFSMAIVASRSEPVGYGIYLWLAATVAADTFCFLRPESHGECGASL